MNKYTHTQAHIHAQHEFTSGESSAVWQAALLPSMLSPSLFQGAMHSTVRYCVMHARVHASWAATTTTKQQQQQLWQLLRLRSRSWVTRLRQVMLWLRSTFSFLSLYHSLFVYVWPLAMHICCCAYHTKHCLTSITDNQQQPLLVYNWSAYKMAACLWIAFPLTHTHSFSCYRLTIERTVPLSLHVWWRTCISFYRHSINT